MTDKEIQIIDNIKSKIHTIRGMQVILDRDLAELYEVETKRINEQVKRNQGRFPKDFCFQLTEIEKEKVVTNCDHLTNLKFSYVLPYSFTEQGIAMLSSVLRSKKAIEINIKIMRAFIAMRHFLKENSNIFQKFQQIDEKFIKYDNQFDKVFDLLETEKPKQGIFYNGQRFDAYKFVCDLVKSSIIFLILSILSSFKEFNIILHSRTKSIISLSLTCLGFFK
jgi:hypothetical protein